MTKALLGVLEWRPMVRAPRDRLILAYCPEYEGLPEMLAVCKWHDMAGFCVDELRSPTLFAEIPMPADAIKARPLGDHDDLGMTQQVLDPPHIEADSFVIDAAMQLGAEPIGDSDCLVMHTSVLEELARRVRHSVSQLPMSNNAR